jgi:hypothetical protein
MLPPVQAADREADRVMLPQRQVLRAKVTMVAPVAPVLVAVAVAQTQQVPMVFQLILKQAVMAALESHLQFQEVVLLAEAEAEAAVDDQTMVVLVD